MAAPGGFKNTYWLLRHGRSHANEQDLIISRPENGQDPRWGLSETGRQQAAAAGGQLAQLLGRHDPAALLVLASPFSRTVETAVGVGAALGIQQGDPRLQVHCMPPVASVTGPQPNCFSSAVANVLWQEQKRGCVWSG
jgi:broad specificity phosphatase PhoE